MLPRQVLVQGNRVERPTDNSGILLCKLLLSKMVTINFIENETETGDAELQLNVSLPQKVSP